MQTSFFIAWSWEGLAKSLMGDSIPGDSKNCYHVLTQLNKKGLTPATPGKVDKSQRRH